MRGESEQPPIDEIDEIEKKRAVLLSRAKDILIKDFFEDDRGRCQENKKYYLISRHASKPVQAQGNLVKIDILENEDRIQCQYCNAKAKPGETFRVCGEVLPGVRGEVQARIRERVFRNLRRLHAPYYLMWDRAMDGKSRRHRLLKNTRELKLISTAP